MPARGWAWAQAPGPTGPGRHRPGGFASPQGETAQLHRRMVDRARRWVPGTMARLGRSREGSPRPSAALGRATTYELKPPRVIAFEYLPGGRNQASPGCAPNGATILSKQRPRGPAGGLIGAGRNGSVSARANSPEGLPYGTSVAALGLGGNAANRLGGARDAIPNACPIPWRPPQGDSPDPDDHRAPHGRRPRGAPPRGNLGHGQRQRQPRLAAVLAHQPGPHQQRRAFAHLQRHPSEHRRGRSLQLQRSPGVRALG